MRLAMLVAVISALPLRGVVLAGGHGTRLLPLTENRNKHLLPVGGKPMILHPIGKLVAAGVVEILVVTGPDHLGQIVATVGSGRDLGCSITYRVQDEAGGIAQALGLAEEFAGGGSVAVVLGDNVFEEPLAAHFAAYSQQGGGARIHLKEVEEPQRYGVPRFDGAEIVVIEEKPDRPASRFCVTGIYCYDVQVYDIIRALRPSARGELEITDVNNAYLARGELQWGELSGWWTDAGTLQSLERANALVAG